MSIHSKLFLLNALILTVALSFGGWTFLNSINAVFENKTHHDTSHDAKMIQTYVASKTQELERKAALISEDESIRASLNLITNYQDPKAYAPLVFDLEKEEVLRQLERWTQPQRNLSVRLFDGLGRLVLQKDYQANSLPSGYISYTEAGEAFLVSGEEKTFHALTQEPTVAQQATTRVSETFYTLLHAEKIYSGPIHVGYVEVGYWIGMADLEVLNRQLIHTAGLYSPQSDFSLFSNIANTKTTVTLYENIVHEAKHPLLAKHYVDKSFIVAQQKKVFAWLLLAGLFTTLVVYSALSYFIKRIVLSPLNRLKGAMESIRTDQYVKGALSVADDEFGKILHYFDEVFEKLSQSYAFLDSYKKVVDEAVIVTQTNLDGNITFVNDLFLEKTGFAKEEVLGKPHNIIRHPDVPCETFRELWQTIQQGNIWKGEICNKAKNGKTFWVDMVVSPIIDSEGNATGYMSIKKDITLLKTIQTKLEEAREVAEKASQAKSDFVANMSHELRTPMNAIIGLSELLKDTHTTHEQEKMLSKILGASKLLLSIINDILDFSKIEAGRLELETVAVPIETLFEQMRAMFEEKAETKNIRFEMKADAEVPAVIVVDSYRLQQVLANLLGNALKFTEEGSVQLHVKLQKKRDNTHAFVCFYIEDTGIGIEKEKADKLFKPFSQADTSTTRKYGGSGLGLVITQKILEAMGSQVKFESEEGIGTRCEFCLEVGVESWKKPSQETKKEKHLSDDLTGVRVLLVEDNEINQEVAAGMLGKFGAQVTLAANGKEAMERLAEANAYDVVLMDIQMPIMGGFEATRQIRKQYKELPIIALSAAAMVEDKDKALEAGMNDHLGKPVDVQLLHEKVAYWAKISKEKEKAILDISFLKEVVGEDEMLKSRLLGRLKNQLLETFSALPGLIKAKDSLAKEHIHTLKGVSGSVGAWALYEISHEIDEAYKQGKSISAVQVAKLKHTIEMLQEELSRL
jgi:PAS domain S-box-containing protein